VYGCVNAWQRKGKFLVTVTVTIVAVGGKRKQRWLQLVGFLNYGSLLQKSPIKETIFGKREVMGVGRGKAREGASIKNTF